MSTDSNHITRDYMDSLLVEQRLLDAVLPDTCLLYTSPSPRDCS